MMVIVVMMGISLLITVHVQHQQTDGVGVWGEGDADGGCDGNGDSGISDDNDGGDWYW